VTARYFVDLHCHTSASFDCLASPESVVRAAASRGLTHLAITDHDRIDGALRARDAAPDGLTIIVGEEVKTADGDLIALFLERAVAPGRPARETIAEVRAQGGLVGIPHPFDRYRGSMLNDPRLEAIGQLVDWVEAHNARVVGASGNERAAAFARELGLPGVAASDAHSTLEVGVAYNVVAVDPSTPEGLLAAMTSVEIVPGRASYIVRTLTPMSKLLNRARGNGRVVPPPAGTVGPPHE
jgi:predicted metal-dependent phosphoesterase TrpH